MKISTIVKYLKKPRKLIKILGVKGFFNIIPDKQYLKIIYWGETGKKLNLSNPKTFGEKLQWIKLNDRKDVYSKYVDKFEVREIIKNKIGENYLIPLIGVYNSVDEINWDELPNRFVLKCTHGSGCNIICKDKNELNIEESKKKLQKWMKKSWFWFGREWPYKNVKARIICEEFISDDCNTPDDYKIMCFNGKAKCIQVHRDRYGNHKEDFYDVEGNLLPFTDIGYENSGIDNIKNVKLQEMIRLAEVLSDNCYHLRVDFYLVKGKLYFGELTFFDGSGFYEFKPKEYNYILGEYIKLPII